METIWRKVFRPQIVQVPWEEYKDFVPCVRVVPIGVDDIGVRRLDEAHRRQLATLRADLHALLEEWEPKGIYVPSKQLLLQLSGIIGGSAESLVIRRGARIVKRVPLDARIRALCGKIANIYNVSVLLFEDHFLLEGSPVQARDQSDDAVSLGNLLVSRSKKTQAISELVVDLACTKQKVVIFARKIVAYLAVQQALTEKGLKCEALFSGFGYQRCYGKSSAPQGQYRCRCSDSTTVR